MKEEIGARRGGGVVADSWKLSKPQGRCFTNYSATFSCIYNMYDVMLYMSILSLREFIYSCSVLMMMIGRNIFDSDDYSINGQQYVEAKGSRLLRRPRGSIRVFFWCVLSFRV